MSQPPETSSSSSSREGLRPPEPRSGSGTGQRAVIGTSIAVRGQLAGREDLTVEGQFEGEMRLPGRQLTIARGGLIEAEVQAATIVVEGEIRGNLVAEREVVIRSSGVMHGDIKSPTVVLEDGCRFRGKIDMEPPPKATSHEKATEDKETSDKAPVATKPVSSASEGNTTTPSSSGAPSGGSPAPTNKPSNNGNVGPNRPHPGGGARPPRR